MLGALGQSTFQKGSTLKLTGFDQAVGALKIQPRFHKSHKPLELREGEPRQPNKDY